MPAKNELYNSKTIKTFIDLVEEKYTDIDVETLLQYSEMNRAQIADPDVWFTQAQVNKFYQKLVELSGGKELAHEAGRYALTAESRSMGIFKSYLLALGSPGQIYATSGKFAKKIDRSTSYITRVLGKNRVEIVAEPNKGVDQEPFQCENRIGNILQVPELCNCELKEFEHEQCIHKGGEVCRYIVSWKETRSSLWKKIRNIAIPLLITLSIIPLYFGTSLTIQLILILSAITVSLSIGWYAEFIEKIKLQSELKSKTNLSTEYNQLLEQSSASYEISIINKEIGVAVSNETNISKILKVVLDVIQRHTDYDRGLILLEDTDKSRLEYKDGFGYSNDDLNQLRRAETYTNRPSQYNVAFVAACKDKKTYVETELKDKNILSVDKKTAAILWAKAFICCPILYEGKTLGVFAVFHTKNEGEFAQRDINLLEGIAPTVGLVIHKTMAKT
ncbi:GAF domain-containing protein [Desulfococcaceae bacterium HSG7]|nr:GAF domain-containing protein [Desulfococcaceae bacterium HSG7]